MSNEQRARQIVARLSQGLPSQVGQAVLEAAERVGWQVSERAELRPALISLSVTVTAGQVSPETFRPGLPLIASLVSSRVYLDDANDDSTMVNLRFEVPSQAGYLLGHADEDLNASVLAEVSSWVPLLKPWQLWPVEEARYTVTGGSGLAGTATAVLGLMGVWLSGFGSL